MLVKIVNHEIRIPRFVSILMERKVEKLTRILYTYQPDSCQLHLDITKVKRKDLYQIKAVLDLPRAVLTVRADHEDFAGAMGDVFQKLFRKIEEYKTNLRHESEYKPEADLLHEASLQAAAMSS